eukprot:TRINITY_DN4208_c0_g1_i1.p1 TRINITY_DN4208_c0_g1~~TRINITY_DN4208_c0_g1_i1.p1  ORF type:complete len:350 (-),score=101.63 TRINITY_DN4208_c0_g1_i1:57-1106(-)
MSDGTGFAALLIGELSALAARLVAAGVRPGSVCDALEDAGAAVQQHFAAAQRESAAAGAGDDDAVLARVAATALETKLEDTSGTQAAARACVAAVRAAERQAGRVSVAGRLSDTEEGLEVSETAGGAELVARAATQDRLQRWQTAAADGVAAVASVRQGGGVVRHAGQLEVELCTLLRDTSEIVQPHSRAQMRQMVGQAILSTALPLLRAGTVPELAEAAQPKAAAVDVAVDTVCMLLVIDQIVRARPLAGPRSATLEAESSPAAAAAAAAAGAGAAGQLPEPPAAAARKYRHIPARRAPSSAVTAIERVSEAEQRQREQREAHFYSPEQTALRQAAEAQQQQQHQHRP